MGRGEGCVCRCGKRYWKEIMELAVAVRMRRREEQIRSSRCIQLVTIRHRFNSLFWTHKKLLLVRFHQLVTICNQLLYGCLEIPNNHFLTCSFFIEFAAFLQEKGASYVWVCEEICNYEYEGGLFFFQIISSPPLFECIGCFVSAPQCMYRLQMSALSAMGAPSCGLKCPSPNSL